MQGWSESQPMLTSPQIGGLFETLVVAEIVKFIRNYGKDWELYFWRTKDGQEIDVIIQTARGKMYAFEIKYAVHGVTKSIVYPPAYLKAFSPTSPLIIVTSGGDRLQLSSQAITLPIALLHDYLLEI